MTTSILTADGSVAIPKEIRQRLGLEAGVRLRVETDSRGAIHLLPEAAEKPPKDQRRLTGLLRHLAGNRPRSIEEMDRAIAEEAGERARKSTADRFE